jgi:hypothetical protein
MPSRGRKLASAPSVRACSTTPDSVLPLAAPESGSKNVPSSPSPRSVHSAVSEASQFADGETPAVANHVRLSGPTG